MTSLCPVHLLWYTVHSITNVRGDGFMDIAALSIAMANQQTQMNASFALMNHTKEVMKQQGDQLVEMLEQSSVKPPHPSLGRKVDIKA